MAGCLHSCLEGPESVISGSVRLITDLILFDLTHIVEFIGDRVSALIDHVDGHVFHGVVAAQSRLVVTHLGNSLALRIVQLEAHVGWVGAEFSLEELFALCDAPVEVEAKLGKEGALHAAMGRIKFHYHCRCLNNFLLHHCFYHFLFEVFL